MKKIALAVLFSLIFPGYLLAAPLLKSKSSKDVLPPPAYCTDTGICCENTGSCVEPCKKAGCPAGKCCVDLKCCTENGCGPSCPFPPAFCGNGIKEKGEECGEPEAGECQAGARCENCVCVIPPPNPCGNSKIDPGEACDDGNQKEGDGCNAQCQVETV